MIRNFNNFNKKDQEALFWTISALLLFLIFLSIFTPIIIIESKTFIKNGLTSNAFVTYMNEKDDGTFYYEVKYIVTNGDTLKSTLIIEDYYEIGESIKIFYSKTNEFAIGEFKDINSYVKNGVILFLIWFVILSLTLFTIFKPKIALKILNSEYKLINTSPNNGDY